MKLKELKAVVAQIEAPCLRLAGFCNDYNKMLDEHQIEVDTQRQKVILHNDDFEDDLPVFGPSETKARILSVPAEYDEFDIILHGQEEDGADGVRSKRVVSARRLDDPADPRNAGLCLLGPVWHAPCRVTIVFADTRINCRSKFIGLDFYLNSDGEVCVSKDFDTEEERNAFLAKHAGLIDESVGDSVVTL